MEETLLEPFYKRIKEIEEDCGYPIQMLHYDLIHEAFNDTAMKEFKQFYQEKTVNKIIDSLLLIKDKHLGEHLVCYLMLMMDEWENNDELYEHETLKHFY